MAGDVAVVVIVAGRPLVSNVYRVPYTLTSGLVHEIKRLALVYAFVLIAGGPIVEPVTTA